MDSVWKDSLWRLANDVEFWVWFGLLFGGLLSVWVLICLCLSFAFVILIRVYLGLLAGLADRRTYVFVIVWWLCVFVVARFV